MTVTPKHAARVVLEIVALSVREKAARTMYDSACLLVQMTKERLPANWDDDALSVADQIDVIDALKEVLEAQDLKLASHTRLIRVVRQLASFRDYASRLSE